MINLKAYSKQLLGQIINCPPLDKEDEDSFTLGETRLCDVEVFVDNFMRTWVNQPAFLGKAKHELNILQKQTFYKSRFCTPEEYLLLFTASQNRLETPVFMILGITNELERTKYKNLFTPDRQGYFKMMQLFNPSLKSFFFPAIHT
jgi:hypothetical protein